MQVYMCLSSSTCMVVRCKGKHLYLLAAALTRGKELCLPATPTSKQQPCLVCRLSLAANLLSIAAASSLLLVGTAHVKLVHTQVFICTLTLLSVTGWCL